MTPSQSGRELVGARPAMPQQSKSRLQYATSRIGRSQSPRGRPEPGQRFGDRGVARRDYRRAVPLPTPAPCPWRPAQAYPCWRRRERVDPCGSRGAGSSELRDSVLRAHRPGRQFTNIDWTAPVWEGAALSGTAAPWAKVGRTPLAQATKPKSNARSGCLVVDAPIALIVVITSIAGRSSNSNTPSVRQDSHATESDINALVHNAINGNSECCEVADSQKSSCHHAGARRDLGPGRLTSCRRQVPTRGIVRTL
jgi:hypothetical protein